MAKRRKRLRVSSALFAMLVVPALSHAEPASQPIERTVEVLSPVYTVDREYRSMMGPSHKQTVAFPYSDPPELIWITGYRASMVGADGETWG